MWDDGLSVWKTRDAMSSLKGKRVLLVDDDAEIVTSIEAALENAEAEVHTARDGNSAVKSLADDPDLVILDVMLPGRSGFLVLEQIRAKTRRGERPFVIMITGNLGKRHQAYAETLGVDGYLNKPFSMERMMDLAEKLFSK